MSAGRGCGVGLGREPARGSAPWRHGCPAHRPPRGRRATHADRGTAVILRGVARVTDDIDATVWAEHLDVEHLLAVLARHEIVGRIPDAAAFAHERQVLLLRHTPTATPMEV